MSEKKNEWIPIAVLSSIGVLILAGFLLAIPKAEPALDHRQELENIKLELDKADKCRRQWNKADREKNEVDRVKHIRTTKKAYENVQDMVNKLRRDPYADAMGEFKPGYEFIEAFASNASTNLHDVLRRSKISDFD
ncbi:MAG: hypothetical protein P1V97_32230 [Planctomycetota bacterium]|nr:hypothetical protein [Planctomycetota bacterium]